MASTPVEVAIIGGGISGLCLALCLHSHSIPCVIYEQRAEIFDQGGSIVLFPNGLSILASLNLYDQVHQLGFDISETVTKNEAYKTVARAKFGDADLYHYLPLRIRRDALLRVLSKAAEAALIPILVNRKFRRVLAESSSEVTFEFTDGEQQSSTLLVGADGIHSRVRHSFLDAPTPVYHGQVGLAWTLQASDILFPSGEEDAAVKEVVRLKTESGIVLLVPERADGKEVRIGLGIPLEDKGRNGWEELAEQDVAMIKLLDDLNVEGDGAGDVLRCFVEGAREGARISAWPIRSMPMAPTWVTKNGEGRVLICGDAAHAFSPAGGQGGSMSLEDAWTLAFAIAERNSMPLSLKVWQHLRQARIEQVSRFVETEMKSRLPGAKSKDSVDEDFKSLAWLYGWRPDAQDLVETSSM